MRRFDLAEKIAIGDVGLLVRGVFRPPLFAKYPLIEFIMHTKQKYRFRAYPGKMGTFLSSFFFMTLDYTNK